VFDITFDIIEFRWMKAEIKTDDFEGTLFSSGIWDAFSEMIEALIKVASGISDVRCNWQEEPGQHTWIFSKVGKEFHFKVVHYETNFSNASEESADKLFEGYIDFQKFASKVMNRMQKMVYEYGEDGFERIWRHPFPKNEMNTLKKLLLKSTTELNK
jgi:hypothetical protein